MRIRNSSQTHHKQPGFANLHTPLVTALTVDAFIVRAVVLLLVMMMFILTLTLALAAPVVAMLAMVVLIISVPVIVSIVGTVD